MSGSISKTDEVRILLNRLAAEPGDSRHDVAPSRNPRLQGRPSDPAAKSATTRAQSGSFFQVPSNCAPCSFCKSYKPSLTNYLPLSDAGQVHILSSPRVLSSYSCLALAVSLREDSPKSSGLSSDSSFSDTNFDLLFWRELALARGALVERFAEMQGVSAALQSKLAAAVELSSSIYKTPTAEAHPDACALEVVLGDRPRRFSESLRRTNSFRRKLFGQPGGSEEEGIASSDCPDSVRIHPHSAFRKYWELAIIALVVYTVIVLPFRAAFFVDYYHDLDASHNIFQQLQVDWMLVTDVFVDLFFVSDIILNFNTGYIAEQVVIMERRLVVTKYLRGWFLLDFVASFPIDLLFLGKRLDIWRLPRLLKIIRVMHYKTFTQAVHDMARLPVFAKISRFHMRILRLLIIVLVWVHWDACLNYGCCAYQQTPRHCWVDDYGLAQLPIKEKYAWSMLKAVSQTITAGYGKHEPTSASDCWVTIISLLAGTFIWTFLASNITTLLISMNAASSEYMVKIQEIDSYMENRHLPQELRRRIRDSYEARWKAEKHFNEEAVLEELPMSLRTEVCMHMCADVIASVPFFEDAEEGFTSSIVTCLRPQVALKGDIVVREGEVSRDMYFIRSGAAQVELGGVPVTVLKSGSYFGEIGLLRNTRRTATVRAVSATLDLFILTKEDFDEVMKTYPESFKAMDLVAEHRFRALLKSPAWEIRHQHPDDHPHLSSKIEHLIEDDEAEVSGSGISEKISSIVATAFANDIATSSESQRAPLLRNSDYTSSPHSSDHMF